MHTQLKASSYMLVTPEYQPIYPILKVLPETFSLENIHYILTSRVPAQSVRPAEVLCRTAERWSAPV